MKRNKQQTTFYPPDCKQPHPLHQVTINMRFRTQANIYSATVRLRPNWKSDAYFCSIRDIKVYMSTWQMCLNLLTSRTCCPTILHQKLTLQWRRIYLTRAPCHGLALINNAHSIFHLLWP